MIDEGIEEKVEVEQQPKKVDEIMIRYLESQKELMVLPPACSV